MTELKAETIVPQGSTVTLQMYPKAEADKVIAGLEDKLREQTYKRCLAMAKWCNDRWADIATPYFKAMWYRKWQLRWLELAEKFKPNNSTAQQGKGKMKNGKHKQQQP